MIFEGVQIVLRIALNIIIINKNLIYTFAMLNCFQIKAGAFQHSQKVAAPEFTGTTKGVYYFFDLRGSILCSEND